MMAAIRGITERENVPLEALDDDLLDVHLANQGCSVLQLQNALWSSLVDDMMWILNRLANCAEHGRVERVEGNCRELSLRVGTRRAGRRFCGDLADISTGIRLVALVVGSRP